MVPKDGRKNKGKNDSEVDKLVDQINQVPKQKKQKKRKKSQNSPEGEKCGQSEKRQSLQRTMQGAATSPINNQSYNNGPNLACQSMVQGVNTMPQPQFYSSPLMNGGQLPYQGQGIMLPDTQPLSQILMSRLDSIDNKLKSLDSINQQLTGINRKISNLEVRVLENESTVKNLQKTVADIEESKNFDSSKITSLCESQKRVDQSHSKLCSDLKSVKEQNTKLSEQLLDLKGRSMRDNLLFFGFPEAQDPRNERCISKILDFCEIELELGDVRETVKIDRAHRLGQRKPNKIRPIVAKFNYFQDKEAIKKASSEKLVNSRFSVGDQFPMEIQQRRRKLIPVMKKALNEGKDAVLVYDKLYIDGTKYTQETAHHVQQSQQRQRRPSLGSNRGQSTPASAPGGTRSNINELRANNDPFLANKFTYLANATDAKDNTSTIPSTSRTSSTGTPKSYTSALTAVLETMVSTDDNYAAQQPSLMGNGACGGPGDTATQRPEAPEAAQQPVDMEIGAFGGSDPTLTQRPTATIDQTEIGARPKTVSVD